MTSTIFSYDKLGQGKPIPIQEWPDMLLLVIEVVLNDEGKDQTFSKEHEVTGIAISF